MTNYAMFVSVYIKLLDALSPKAIPSVSCDLAFHAILAFYAVFIASYTQCALCDWIFALHSCCGKIISSFGKN